MLAAVDAAAGPSVVTERSLGLMPVGSTLTGDILDAGALTLDEVPTKWGLRQLPDVRPGNDGVNRAVADHFRKTDTVYAYSIFLSCER